MRNKYIVLQPVYLGKGSIGEKRKEALLEIAKREKCYWNGQPSIGRLLIKLADKELENDRSL